MVAGLFTSAYWLPWWGTFLVQADQPAKADAILVLGGDWTGNRILKAAQLAQAGYSNVIYVSGPVALYGTNEAELSIAYAARHGFPAAWFHPVAVPADSTRQEAERVWPRLRESGVRRLLIVTSDFHTRRARRAYRRVAPEAEIRLVAASWPGLHVSEWWKTRQSRKIIFLEWLKMVADALGM